MTTDLPARVLAGAVAALPARRRGWGRAMLAELGEIEGRTARWQFARSCVVATLLIPPAGGWSVLALVVGASVASVAATGSVVGVVVPGLAVFAMVFVGLMGAFLALGVARSYRPRMAAPVPAALVGVFVAGAITATVVFLVHEPAASRYLPASAAVYLAVALVACLVVAMANPPTRLAPYLGVAAAVVFAGWFELMIRLEGTQPPVAVVTVLGAALVLVPFALFGIPSFLAARRGPGLRAGLAATAWAVTASMPLLYGLALPAAMRRHALDGHTLDGEVFAPVGADLPLAIFFCLGFLPVFGLLIGTAGAAVGTRHRPT